MARYGRIERRMVHDEWYSSLDPFGKQIWTTLLHHPAMTPMGAGVIYPETLDREIGRQGDICWKCERSCDEHRAERYLETFQETSRIYRDNLLVVVKKYLLHNLPDNPNILVSWINSCEELPRSPCYQDLLAYLQEELHGQPTWLFDGLLRPLATHGPRGLVAHFWERVGLEKKSGPRGRNVSRDLFRDVTRDLNKDVTGNRDSGSDSDKILPTDQPAKQRTRANRQPASPPTSTPGVISQELRSVILAMQVEGFHVLAEPTKANQVFWGAQLELIESHDTVDLFACLRDVDAHYATSPEDWPKNRDEAARRMKSALAVAVTKIEEAQEQRQERRRPYVRRAAG